METLTLEDYRKCFTAEQWEDLSAVPFDQRFPDPIGSPKSIPSFTWEIVFAVFQIDITLLPQEDITKIHLVALDAMPHGWWSVVEEVLNTVYDMAVIGGWSQEIYHPKEEKT